MNHIKSYLNTAPNTCDQYQISIYTSRGARNFDLTVFFPKTTYTASFYLHINQQQAETRALVHFHGFVKKKKKKYSRKKLTEVVVRDYSYI